MERAEDEPVVWRIHPEPFQKLEHRDGLFDVVCVVVAVIVFHD